VKQGDLVQVTHIDIRPLVDPDTQARCLLVLFRDEPPVQAMGAPASGAELEQHSERFAELERELGATKTHLQTTIEELEASNEELKASNEELQSANEELQSTNEELETAKEELEATNEELTTVNDE